MRSDRYRALGIALGFAADLAFSDPSRLHPVAGFGRVALALEGVLHPDGPAPAVGVAPPVAPPDDDRPDDDWPDDDEVTLGGPAARARGIAFTAALVGGATGAAVCADRLAARSPLLRAATTGVVVWACLGGTSLLRVAGRQADLLERGDVAGSRELLPWLCGRDPSSLDADDLARAVVESVAENTSDAAVATLVWAAIAGPAGAVAHRAANTLDAMVGHRSVRYAEFGWASARLDDALGWPAARIAGLATVLLAPAVGGAPAATLRVWRRDASSHPSPNAGVVEAATAGALGVRLGGRTPYPYGVQHRPVLGDGSSPGAGDVWRAVRLMRSVQVATAAAAVVAGALVGPAVGALISRAAGRRA